MKEIPSLAVAADGRSGADLLVAGCFQGAPPDVEALPEPARRAAQGVAARSGWSGRDEQLGQAAGEDGQVVALYGLGPAAELTFAKLARWFTRVAEDARNNGVRRLAFALPRHAEMVGQAAALRVTRCVALGDYRFDRYRSDADTARLETVDVIPPEGAETDYRAALPIAEKVAAAVCYTRDLCNVPGNEATPPWVEEQARQLAGSHGLDCTVLDAAELASRGMGGLLAVGAGSVHAPRLLRLALGDDGPGPLHVLVGKGVTFDTGGISIKPAADMEQMKFDKSGACVVLGAMRAAAEHGLPGRLRAYLPVAENMLGGEAYRPGDIVRCFNGKTVEITNTDCEGRMILADALALAAEEGPADALVELSTLTGGCVVALGSQAAGLFSPDDGFATELQQIAAGSGERLWRLPLLPEFLDEMKSLHADLRNSAGRWGSACTAAAFLSQFVGAVRHWAHLDIAGVAYARSEDGRGTAATGFGVASLVDWLRHRATQSPAA